MSRRRPPAVSGGFGSLFAAAVVALVLWLVGAATGRLNRETEFAFGPWLGFGMVVCLVAFAAAPVLG